MKVQEYHKGGVKSMRKIRRAMQFLFLVVFLVGIGEGMTAKHLAAVIISGLAVVALASNENRKEK